MSIYVDPLMNHGWVLRGRRVNSCHLLADTVDELHVFAQEIGLRRSWYQGKGSRPHYDLVASKRVEAVLNGAVELNDHASLRAFFKRTRPRRKRKMRRPV